MNCQQTNKEPSFSSASSAVKISSLVATTLDFYLFLMIQHRVQESMVLPNVTFSITFKEVKTISLKIPEDLERQLRDIAQRKGVKISEWIREAMEEKLKKEPKKKALTAADTFGKYAGAAGGGPRDLSTNPKYLEGLGQ